MKVILDSDLAELYGVETKVLNQAVRRNLNRFPEDFAFLLTAEEFSDLRSQIVTSSWGGRRYPPYAFTEYGAIGWPGCPFGQLRRSLRLLIVKGFSCVIEMSVFVVSAGTH